MRLSAVMAGGLVVIAGAAVILATVFWGRIPGVPISPAEMDELLSYPGTISYEIVPSTAQVITTSLVIPVVLVLVAIFVASRSAGWKLTSGGAASACSAVIAFAVLVVVASGDVDVNFLRAAIRSLVVAAIAFLLGSAAVYVALKWWPNKSLERTRGR